MRAGELDRLVTIEQPQEVQDETGDPVTTWVPFAQVWAGRRDLGGKEFFDGDRPLSEGNTTFRIYYLAGVTAKMRVRDEDDRIYDIQHTSEIGRREGLLLICTTQDEES